MSTRATPKSNRRHFQTGTTAGDLVITAELGGYSDQATIGIAPAAVHVDSGSALRGASTLVVEMSGFDNTRTVSQMVFTFYDGGGAPLPAAPIRVDVSADFRHWFEQSTAGRDVRAQGHLSGDRRPDHRSRLCKSSIRTTPEAEPRRSCAFEACRSHHRRFGPQRRGRHPGRPQDLSSVRRLRRSRDRPPHRAEHLDRIARRGDACRARRRAASRRARGHPACRGEDRSARRCGGHRSGSRRGRAVHLSPGRGPGDDQQARSAADRRTGPRTGAIAPAAGRGTRHP